MGGIVTVIPEDLITFLDTLSVPRTTLKAPFPANRSGLSWLGCQDAMTLLVVRFPCAIQP